MNEATATRSQLHPVFQAALASFSAAPSQLQQIQRAAYVKALKAHDWSFEFSEDHSRYERGREQLVQLKLAQRELDPEFEVWNQHCPQSCKGGRSYA